MKTDIGKMPCTLWVLFTLGTLLLLPATAPAMENQPAVRHRLTVTLDPGKHFLSAMDTIEITGPGLSRIEFDLAGHLLITSVKVNDSAGSYTFKGGRLQIAMPPGSEHNRLQIDYQGRFDDPAPRAPVNTDNPGFGVTGTIQPQGAMLLADAGWYPRHNALDAAFDLTVDAPEGMLAVSSGKPSGHITDNGRTLSRWSVPRSLRGLSLVAGPYEVSTRVFGHVRAATYFSKPLQYLSNDYLAATGRYLQLYEELFGPYAFDQFAVVENFFPTGYGFPSFTLMGGRVLQLPFIIHTSLGHEIAHCWWGNGVLVDPSQGNWSEALTTYVADYLYREHRGEGKDLRLQWLRNYAGLVNAGNDFPLSQFTSRTDPATRTVGYDKGAMVFHMLRKMVGDDLFWQCLRGIYARHLFEAITWSDIRNAFEQRSGLSLESFFRQWVFRSGAPALALSDAAVQPTNAGLTVSGYVTQQQPYFDLTLDLVLQTEDRTLRKTLTLSGARTAFSIPAAGRPQRLTADPDYHIFRQLAPGEIPPTVNTIKGSGTVRVIVARDLGSGGLDTARRLAVSLGLAQAPISLEKDFSAHELAGSDWILVGRPSSRTLLPDEGGRFTLSAGNFILNGQDYARDQVSFVGVFKNPLNPKRAVALFLPADPSLAATIGTKITHYGPYSYLIFNGARNQLKGTWAADHSPLTIRWPAKD